MQDRFPVGGAHGGARERRSHEGYGACGFAPPDDGLSSCTSSDQSSFKAAFHRDKDGALLIHITRGKVLFMGLSMLVVLAILPMWDCATLLGNINFNFWCDRDIPITLLVVSPLLVVLYFFTIEAVFVYLKPPATQALPNFVMVASMFATLVGISSILVALPMRNSAQQAHDDIRYRCDSSQTRPLRNFYMTALRLRESPGCESLASIKQCEGWQDSPFSLYLEKLERDYRCSGFCYHLPFARGGSLLQVNESTMHYDAPPEIDLLGMGLIARRASAKLSSLHDSPPQRKYPPTLFSRANFQVSCDGAAARDLMNTGRDIAVQMWYSGMVMVAIATCMGLMQWTTKANDSSHRERK